jgi:hypothetical protein
LEPNWNQIGTKTWNVINFWGPIFETPRPTSTLPFGSAASPLAFLGRPCRTPQQIISSTILKGLTKLLPILLFMIYIYIHIYIICIYTYIYIICNIIMYIYISLSDVFIWYILGGTTLIA